MTVGIARLTLYLPQSHSLKEKRMVLRRVKDRLKAKFNVAVAEVRGQRRLAAGGAGAGGGGQRTALRRDRRWTR